MPKADATAVARLLSEFGQYSALQGGNPYRAKAYIRAAESLATLAVPLESLISEGALTDIPGVGEAIADIITKFHRTGTRNNRVRSSASLRMQGKSRRQEKLPLALRWQPSQCFAADWPPKQSAPAFV